MLPINTYYHIGNTPPKQVTSAKYLGVIIDNNLSGVNIQEQLSARQIQHLAIYGVILAITHRNLNV